jgi:hypothetical protein
VDVGLVDGGVEAAVLGLDANERFREVLRAIGSLGDISGDTWRFSSVVIA